jgi:hypothetical protein
MINKMIEKQDTIDKKIVDVSSSANMCLYKHDPNNMSGGAEVWPEYSHDNITALLKFIS